MTTLLVIDIGNTNVSLGLFDYRDEKPGVLAVLAHRHHRGADRRGGDDALRALRPRAPRDVRSHRPDHLERGPPAAADLGAGGVEAVRPPALVVGLGIRTGMPVRYENPREVGADRIVNSVAAFEMFGGPVIAVDFGTATTFDCVSREGEYLGGAMFPGIHISMEALFERASMLHRVELARPKAVIGRTTTAALQSGLLYGYAGVVDAMVERIRAELARTRTSSRPAGSRTASPTRRAASSASSRSSPSKACASSSKRTALPPSPAKGGPHEEREGERHP